MSEKTLQNAVNTKIIKRRRHAQPMGRFQRKTVLGTYSVEGAERNNRLAVMQRRRDENDKGEVSETRRR